MHIIVQEMMIFSVPDDQCINESDSREDLRVKQVDAPAHISSMLAVPG
jgi:hypothetical protein